jgi:parallel beta-helix repeat protein
VVKDCAATGNSGSGVVVSGDRSIVENCTADGNSSMGIVATGNGTGTVIRNCSASDNVTDGINVYRYCLVIGNISTGNGNGAPSGAGIHATSFSNRIEGNMVLSNDRGIYLNLDATNNVVIRNTATNNTTQFDIIVNNKVATIISPLNSGVISGSTGGTSFGEAWANISY